MTFNIITTIKVLSAALIAAVVLSNNASATLVNDDVNANLGAGSGLFGLTVFDGTATVVDPGVEFTGMLDSDIPVELDLSASGFSITMENMSNNFAFSSFLFDPLVLQLTSLDWTDSLGTISAVNILSNDFDFGSADVSFGLNDITVQIASAFSTIGFSPRQIRTAEFEIVAEHAAVPEPANIALLGVGLTGLGFSRRKKAQS